jgi:GT2 family glycosyltransferase
MGMLNVAVCIATYQRPTGLARLVQGLQLLDVECGDALSPEIIIVDNDPAGSAGSLCAQLAREGRWQITYIREPRKGTPFARNAVVRCALERGADLLAFIDDDEAPDATWLRELVLTMAHHAADIVAGPVLPEFEPDVPRWILKGGFFELPRRPTGTQLDRAFTNNVLVRAEVFSRVGRLFDERFLLGVGEDTDFFLRAVRAGCKIVWANDAIVHEWIPASRTRVMWLLRRSYTIGIYWGQLRIARDLHRRLALRNLVKGMLWCPVSVFQGRHVAVRALQLIATGVGYLSTRAGSWMNEHRDADANGLRGG